MNNEETRVLNQKQTEKTIAKTLEKKSSKSEKVAYAAGGFTAGVASGVVGSAFAASTEERIVVASETPESEEIIAVQQETVISEQEEPIEVATESVPNPEEVLLATDEGMRVAQVNDDASFAEAFADARAQVGAGGTFEWRDHVYSTYYEEEWNNMSTEERANYQSKIDYKIIAGETYTDKPAIAASSEEFLEVKPATETLVDETSTNKPLTSSRLGEDSEIESMTETVADESIFSESTVVDAPEEFSEVKPATETLVDETSTNKPLTSSTLGGDSEIESMTETVAVESISSESTVVDASEEVSELRPMTETVSEDTITESALAANAEMVDDQSAQGDIKILGVEAVIDPQGNQMTVAAIEVDNEQALFVDVDNNGMMDVIMVDENYDGQISGNEIYDTSDAEISTADLQSHMAASQDSGMMMACDDGMLDYMNDADVSSMV